MKSNLTKSVADHIIAQNQKLKHQVIHLQKNLKIFQTKMMEALDQLTSSLSSKTQNYQQLLLFDNPYDCLTAFVQQVIKSTSFSLNTSDQNQKLSVQNKQLSRKIKRLEDQSVQRIRKEQEIIEQLNKSIQQKKHRLLELQQDYTSLLKTKKTAERELIETKEQMKILRLKLYEQQRQKLTQIIVAGKKEMMEFRKNMEMQSYKQQVQFKKEIGEKDRQIKLLTKNIQELINSNLTASSDLTILQKIVKPIRQSTKLKDQIIVLRKQVFAMKNQLRDKESKILGLQGQNADITLSRDNLRSRNQRLQIQKNLLILELQQKTEQLQTAIKDRKALDLYYTEKWHSQFTKVRLNLQDKYNTKLKLLQKQFQKKKKQTQAQIQAHLQRLRITKNELTLVNTKVQQLSQVNELLNKKIDNLNLSLNQAHSVIRQSQHFHTQHLFAHTLKWQELQDFIRKQTRKWEYSSKKLQYQLNKSISQFNTQRTNSLHEKWKQIESLKKDHKNFIIDLQKKHQQELNNLENHYSNAKQAIQAGRVAQMIKFQQKQKQINLKYHQQLKQADKLADLKIQKFNQKFNQQSFKYQKLRKQREQQIQDHNIKLGDLQKVLHQRELQLIRRDVELEEYKKMKETYISQITSLNLKLNEQSFQRRSLKVQFQSLQKKLTQKQELIKILESKKYKFKQDIINIQAEYKEGFSQLDRIHKKALFQCKMKISDLERLFEKRPIKKQHYVHIQDLQKKNHELKTEIQLKQAENLIISQVKQYYEQKANQQYLSKPSLINNTMNQQDPSRVFLSTNNVLRYTNSNMRDTVKVNQKPVFVKKYSNRKNKLIASAIKLDYFQENQKEPETKEIAQMKRYLSRQHRINETSVTFKTRTQPDRSKSCLN